MKFDKWLGDKDSKHNYWVTLQNEEGILLHLVLILKRLQHG